MYRVLENPSATLLILCARALCDVWNIHPLYLGVRRQALHLKKGRVRLYRTEGAREFTLEVVEAGTVFGRMAFTPYRLRESYARAIVPSVIFAMERADVERLIEEKPQVGIRIISLLSERLHYYETRMQDITLKGVPARLASLILFFVESEGVQIPGEIRIPTRYS